jgi:DNA-directed RNA polymerase specialized sigma24 family protein
MSADALLQVAVREPRAPAGVAFDRLLKWLDDGIDSHGDTYLKMHRLLVSYFERRNRPAAVDLADETLNRIATTLEKDGAIATKPPLRYCYTIARFVLLEDFRRQHTQFPLRCVSECNIATTNALRLELDEGHEIQQQRFECLERSLQKLHPDRRALVIEYYRDAGRQKIVRRRDMAKRLGVSMNALSIRVRRIRSALEASVETCRKERQPSA